MKLIEIIILTIIMFAVAFVANNGKKDDWGPSWEQVLVVLFTAFGFIGIICIFYWILMC